MNERNIGFFVGVGDFKRQNRLAAARRDSGWFTGKSTESDGIRKGMDIVQGAHVEINGADAGECVPLLAAEALARGAKTVSIPLKLIMTSFEGDDPLYTRAKELASKLDVSTALQDSRLIVTPRHVWDQAKKWRMIGQSSRYFREHGVGE